MKEQHGNSICSGCGREFEECVCEDHYIKMKENLTEGK